MYKFIPPWGKHVPLFRNKVLPLYKFIPPLNNGVLRLILRVFTQTITDKILYMKFPRMIKINLIAFLLLGCAQTATPTPEVRPSPTKESIYYSNTTVSLTFDDGDADIFHLS
jgi:hypothetical protein